MQNALVCPGKKCIMLMFTSTVMPTDLIPLQHHISKTKV